MAFHDLLFLLPLSMVLFSGVSADLNAYIKSSLMNPFSCSSQVKPCNASLYHINYGTISEEQIAAFYSVNVSRLKPIMYSNRQDYLITVPCSCNSIAGTTGYFYDTSYRVKPGDSFADVCAQIYSGQALNVSAEVFIPNTDFTMHLLCGCVETDSQVVVTYTVQMRDTISSIAALLSAKVENVVSMNKNLIQNPAFIDLGWVLFVPMEKNGLETPKPGELYMVRI